METRILYLFTRTPLHVGAGSSVGAIDQPIIRERHTGFPVIPGSSIKGTFADLWNDTLEKDQQGKRVRGASEAAWLFGSDTTDASAAGSLIFSEARILAFPVRSARGGFAWLTCPLALRRAARDGVIRSNDAVSEIKTLQMPTDTHDTTFAAYDRAGDLDIDGKVVLEDLCLHHTDSYPAKVACELSTAVPDETILAELPRRLVVVSDGTMTHYVTTSCEVAQHVRISDETGTAEGTGLFNQENVPSETLFYIVLRATKGRVKEGGHLEKNPSAAIETFLKRLAERQPLQFGADATTGLGFCSVCPAPEATVAPAALPVPA